MLRALHDAGIAASEIDYVNAHGTGTPLNDSSEGRAILNLCPGAPTSSTKSMTGTRLGAAGANRSSLLAGSIEEWFSPAEY